jgi:glutamate-1-semialdehyde aminotransferase
MTGFRVAFGGAQALFGITPDLTCLGKVIGGGLPVAAYGGRADIMRLLAPSGAVYQAGTLSGNPLAMAAGIATLRELEARHIYERLADASAALAAGVERAAAAAGVSVQTAAIGGMWGFFLLRIREIQRGQSPLNSKPCNGLVIQRTLTPLNFGSWIMPPRKWPTLDASLGSFTRCWPRACT